MDNQDVVKELASLIMGQSFAGDPIRYANMIRATRSPSVANMRALLPEMKQQQENLEKTAKQISEFRKHVTGDNYARRRQDSFKAFQPLDKQADLLQGNPVDISILLSTHFDNISLLYTSIVQGAELIVNAKMVTIDESMDALSTTFNEKISELGKQRVDALLSGAKRATKETLDALTLEQKINQGATTSFTQGISILEKIPKLYENYLTTQSRIFEIYFERLRNRHSNGLAVCKFGNIDSATLTDAVILVWDNIDKVGEIEGGTDKDKLSAYTLHRANSMIEAARQDDVWVWLVDPGTQLIKWVKSASPLIKSLQDFVVAVKQDLGESTWKLSSCDIKKITNDFTDVIDSLDLTQIAQKPPERALSKIERFAMEHRNQALQEVANHMISGHGLKTIVDDVLDLKVKERNFYINVNSFYVTKIGSGNVFSGEAPGALEVIPGERPNASLEHIWGGGFDEMRSFISGMDEARKWQPLFLSTSPSKSTDKNNILLVGPQGCGKTELMRAIGCAPGNIAIFAVGSSFLTCWLGEAQKNPGRLFDEAVKLHKNSGKPVYLLLDEIDSVLNDDRGSSSRINLSTEFQNLMDGIVAYPGISIVGATNHPERIPTPMLRRFAKVMVVGELTEYDATQIMKHYIHNFLPCAEGFTDEVYHNWYKRLDGATGDGLRKIVDEVWLNFMRGFISSHKEEAEKIISFIKENYGETFEVASLSEEDRAIIRKMIADTGSVVTVEMVDAQIEKMLNNFAFQEQIKKARETYRNSKLLLEKQKAGDKGLGF